MLRARLRVLVADERPIVREGLKCVLNACDDIEVVGEAADGRSALECAAELRPDVVVFEATLPGLGCAQVATLLRTSNGACKVVVLTHDEDHGRMRLLLGAGAGGYLSKRAAPGELVGAIRAVADGGVYLDPLLAVAALGEYAGHPPDREPHPAELSERESEVVRRIVLGYSNKEIAAGLGLSVKTVETYKSRSLEKLGMRSRVDLVRFAARRGWFAGV